MNYNRNFGLIWATKSNLTQILLILFLCSNLQAQQLITFAGHQQGSTQSAYIGWSVGELLIQPLSSTRAVLTQGFRQPLVEPLPDETSEKECTQRYGLSIYNGLTPNGDQTNEGLLIKGIEQYPENELYIFNRWHTPLFHQKNYNNAMLWEGKSANGTALPAGVYYYRLYLDPADRKKRCEGRILIVY